MPQRKVLLSDDLNLFLEMEKSLFERHDIELLVAGSGGEVLSLMVRERPDLVLIDLHMPEMDGDECCRRAKADPALRPIPFVLMASASWEEEVDRCRRAGCDGIAFKPLNRAHLLKTVRELLGIADRAALRRRTVLDVFYGASAGENHTGACHDLSVGGLFLETAGDFPVGTPLRLLFHLPARPKAVHCRGRVAWVNSPSRPLKGDLPPGVGVQFTEISTGDLEAIRAFSEEAGGGDGPSPQ